MNARPAKGRLATAWLAAAIAGLWILACEALHRPLYAQEAAPSSTTTALPTIPSAAAGENHIPLDGWLLAGVDATFHQRFRIMAYGGYVGGFDSWIVLTDGSVAVNGALQILAGQFVVRPTDGDAPATSVLRAGVNWSPLRGRVNVDNRLFVERRSTANRVTPRVRDRVRLSWAIAEASPVRLFTSVEFFAVDRHGLSERRYQAGLALPIERVSVETYWLRSTARSRPAFDILGVTMLWRIARR